MKHIWFIRHGESLANAGAATSDPAAIPLTERGHRQAQKLAQSFSTEPNMVITSPYRRTAQTAAPTLERYSQIRSEIREIQEFTYLAPARCVNTTSQDRRVMVDEYWSRADPLYVDGEGAESFGQMLGRAQELWRRVWASGEGKHIFIFTHGLFMNALRYFPPEAPTALSSRSINQFHAYHRQSPIANCGILKCHVDNGSGTIMIDRQAGSLN